MNCSVTPPPSQCQTKAAEYEDNTIDVNPTKAIKDCTWSDILVSPEQINPCVRKANKKTAGATVPCSPLAFIGNVAAFSISLDEM